MPVLNLHNCHKKQLHLHQLFGTEESDCNQEKNFLSKIGKHPQLCLKEIDATCRHQNCILPKYYDHQEEVPDHNALSDRLIAKVNKGGPEKINTKSNPPH